MSADGILIVNKPAGRSSRWATNRVSRLLSEKKAGHLGTLDPIATGVLPIALGRATRLIRFLESGDKVYRGVVRLGQATDTQDAAGEVVSEGDCSAVTKERIKSELDKFVGEIEQVPPMHSALKRGGKPLYKLARQGIEVEREPRKVRIFEISLGRVEPPEVEITVRCAPGTYMRTLAHDLGQELGCGAHLASLVRLANGPFTIEEAADLDELDPETARARLTPLVQCLPHFPAVEISDERLRILRDGTSLVFDNDEAGPPAGSRCRLVHKGRLAAVADAVAHGDTIMVRPLRVFL